MIKVKCRSVTETEEEEDDAPVQQRKQPSKLDKRLKPPTQSKRLQHLKR